MPSDAGKARQREVVEAFLRAAREGDLEGLLALLDPDAVLRIDAAVRVNAPAAEAGRALELRGASKWAAQLIALSRGRGRHFVEPALINGSVGLLFAPGGTLSRALTFNFTDATITRVEVIGDPARLRDLDIAVL